MNARQAMPLPAARPSPLVSLWRKALRRLRPGRTPTVAPPRKPMALRAFEEILVMPPTRPIMPGQYLRDAGPVWPQFHRQKQLRFRRESKVMDRRPPDWTGPEERLDEELLWGGTITPHFGHLVAESIPRLFASACARPDLRLALVAPEPGWPAKGPAYLSTILDWLGIAPERLVFIEKPTRIARLWAMPQPEVLDGPAPPQEYTELLERNAQRQGLILRPEKTLFVTRASAFRSGRGGLVGESYLSQCLASAGIAVTDAGAIPLTAQMQAYATARTLIMVEGSAQIGRQLLGRIDQDIHVLHRRPGSRLAEHTLAARCRRLEFTDCIRAMAVPHRDGIAQPDYLAPAFVDVAVLHRFFAALGIDLAPLWNAADFDRAQRGDVADWWQGYRATPRDTDPLRTAENLFAALALTGLWNEPTPPVADAAMDALSQDWLTPKGQNHA